MEGDTKENKEKVKIKKKSEVKIEQLKVIHNFEFLTVLLFSDPSGRFGHFSFSQRLAQAKPMLTTPKYMCLTTNTNKPCATAGRN